MARLALNTKLQNLTSIEELRRFVMQSLDAIVRQFNGKVDLVDNIRVSRVTVSFTKPNTPVTINHSLGRLPQGYLVNSSSASGVVTLPASGTSQWTSTSIVLQGSGIMTVQLLIN